MNWQQALIRFILLLLVIMGFHIAFNMLKGGTSVKPIITQFQATQAFTMATLYALFSLYFTRKNKK
jgi:hypothetical protein